MRVILTAVARTPEGSHAETMTTPRARLLTPTIAIVTLAVLLTGCAGTGNGASSAPTPEAASTGATTSAPTATPTSGLGTTPSTPGTAPASAAPSGSTTASGGSPAGAGDADGARCTVAELSGSIADGGGGGGAGAERVAIVLRDSGTRSCTLQGWPGVSFVGGGDGAQIGNPATLDRSAPHPTLTLRPGHEVQAVVTVEQSGDWDAATCEPRTTDGFRVIPPGSRQSLFVAASGSLFEACASTSIHQLTTTALASF